MALLWHLDASHSGSIVRQCPLGQSWPVSSSQYLQGCARKLGEKMLGFHVFISLSFSLLGLRYTLPSLLKWNHVPRCRVLNLSLPPSFSMMAIVHLYGGVWSCSLDKTSSQASVLVAFIWWENRGDCSVCTEALRLLGGVTPAHCPSSNLSLHAADYWEGGWLSFHSHP